MTNKLRTLLVSLGLLGAVSAAVAQTGGLLGNRYGAFDLGYVDFKGGDLWGASVELNVPSTIRNIDFAFECGYGDYDYDLSILDSKAWYVAAAGTYHEQLTDKIVGFFTGQIGYEDNDVSITGYTFTGRKNSFFYDVSAGVEFAVAPKAAVRVALGHYDYTEFDEGSGIYATLGANYWFNETVGMRGHYTRDFDDDSNTFSLGLVVRY